MVVQREGWEGRPGPSLPPLYHSQDPQREGKGQYVCVGVLVTMK